MGASDMGRLDHVALALTVLGVSLAVMAFSGFFVVRAAAMHAAREEVREKASMMIPDLVTPRIIAAALQTNPQLVLSALNMARGYEPDVDGSDADKIAEAANGDGNG